MKKIFTLILLTLTLLSCSKNNGGGSEKQEQVLSYDLIEEKCIEWDKIFLQDEDDYLVYFFRETCGHCNAIKSDVLSYYLLEKEVMYFIKNPNNPEYFSKTMENLRGINDISNFKIYGVPLLLEILNGEVLNYHYGEKQILDYLSVQQK